MWRGWIASGKFLSIAYLIFWNSLLMHCAMPGLSPFMSWPWPPLWPQDFLIHVLKFLLLVLLLCAFHCHCPLCCWTWLINLASCYGQLAGLSQSLRTEVGRPMNSFCGHGCRGVTRQWSTSSEWWWGTWLSAAAHPALRACGLALTKMAAGPHGEIFGKDLWHKGSLDRVPLWDQVGLLWMVWPWAC